jgi:predicted molibdopterin-dependent oxidoreductase YjgC
MRITINGKATEVAESTSVAAAVLAFGIDCFRRSVSGEPRAPLCGIGTCFECRVTIDGLAQQRSCLIPCREGMKVETA